MLTIDLCDHCGGGGGYVADVANIAIVVQVVELELRIKYLEQTEINFKPQPQHDHNPLQQPNY